MINKTAERLRDGTRRAYSAAAERPLDNHPFPVGSRFAEDVGYPRQLLSSLPSISAEAFSGVSNVSVFADIPAGSIVLDLGCGAGLDSLIAARQTGERGRVISIDFSNSMLSRARQAAILAKAQNVEFYQAEGENLPIGDAKIDIALVNGIFNLNPEREAIFQELARVIREGGTVYTAELILKAPLPPEIQDSDVGWFAWISGAREGGAFLEEFRSVDFREAVILQTTRNARCKNPLVLVAEVRARK